MTKAILVGGPADGKLRTMAHRVPRFRVPVAYGLYPIEIGDVEYVLLWTSRCGEYAIYSFSTVCTDYLLEKLCERIHNTK